MNNDRLEQLKAGDIVATGRPGDTPHVGVYTGGENVFHQSRKRGLKAGNYPDLNYFKQGGYFVRPNASTGAVAGAGSPGKILGSERRQTLATQQTDLATQAQKIANLVEEKRATDDAAIAIENYVAAIAPVAEQQLQNSVLEKRVSLMKAGLSGDLLDTEVKIFEQQEKERFGIALLTEGIAKNNQAVTDGKMDKKIAIRLNAEYADSIDRLMAQNPKMIQLLKDEAVSQRNANFEASQRNLLNEIDLAKALTPEAEMRVRMNQSGVTNPDEQNILMGLEKAKTSSRKIKARFARHCIHHRRFFW